MNIGTNKITFDWSMNLGHVVTIIVIVIGGVCTLGAYTEKFHQMETFMSDQKATDKAQDDAREKAVADIKQQLKENKDDIRSEIRDLRTDIFRLNKK